MGAMGAMVLTTTTREFSVFPNILKKSPIAHVCDGRDGRDWRDGRYFQYPPFCYARSSANQSAPFYCYENNNFKTFAPRKRSSPRNRDIYEKIENLMKFRK